MMTVVFKWHLTFVGSGGSNSGQNGVEGPRGQKSRDSTHIIIYDGCSTLRRSLVYFNPYTLMRPFTL